MSGVRRTRTATDVLNPMVWLLDNWLNAAARTRATLAALRAGVALRDTLLGGDADGLIRNRSFDAEFGDEAPRTHLHSPPAGPRTDDELRLS
jgi:hypothetical protein